MKHVASSVETPYGHKGICTCGTYAVGFFGNAARAKRAIMNSSHGDPTEAKFDPRVKFVETKEVK